jgi:O-antigen/teichoic acid export membrane protein
MGLRGKSLQGSAVLTIGEALIYGSSLVRNMILARLLTKADFGIAATLAMTVTLLEFSAKLGVARFVVRDKQGDQPDFIATAHMVQGVAAVISALVLVSAAWPLSRLFGVTDHLGSLLALAVIPLFHGLNHLDVRRFERELRFGPSVWVDVIPQAAITLLAWPVAAWLGDYRAVLVLLILKALLSCGASHWLAERRYQWRHHREYTGRMLRFGWPLLINGFVMFGVMHGDQFIIATFYAMEELGPYAAAAALALAPTFCFKRVFFSVMLPVMAKVQDDAGGFERRYRFVMAIMCAFSAAYAGGLVMGAEVVMQLAFGEKYAGTGIILGWLAIANSARNIRSATALAAMAKGDSVNQMVSNLWRVLGLLPAIGVAVMGFPVWMIATTGLLGEALACWVSFRRLSRRDGIPLRYSLLPASLVLLLVTLTGVISLLLNVHNAHPVLAVGLALGAGCLCGGLVMVILADSRREVTNLISSMRTQGWRGMARLMKISKLAKPPAPSGIKAPEARLPGAS